MEEDEFKDWTAVLTGAASGMGYAAWSQVNPDGTAKLAAAYMG